MSIALEERISKHASYLNTESALQLLDGIDSRSLSANTIQKLGRVRENFIFLKDALDKVDPWLVSTSTLTTMNNNIGQIVSLLTNFKNSSNEQYLDQIFSHLEVLLQFFSQLVITKTPDDIEGVRNAVVSFRKSVGQHLSNVEKEATDTKTALNRNAEKLNEFTVAIESQKTRIDSVVSDIQSQFLQAQSNRNDEFNSFIKTGEEEFLKIIKSSTDNYNELNKEFEQQVETNVEGFEQQIEANKEAFGTLIEELKTKFQTEFDQLHTMNKEAEKIIGLISMKGLAQGYQKIANDEGKKAFLWNLGSIGSMIAVIIFGVIFLLMHEGTFDWTTLISRMVLTGIGLTLFTYCAKQATNHRDEERRNRKIELELASLDPYLKDFDSEKQKQVKETLVSKYFGVESSNTADQQGQTSSQQNAFDAISNNPQIINLLVEKVTQQMSAK